MCDDDCMCCCSWDCPCAKVDDEPHCTPECVCRCNESARNEVALMVNTTWVKYLIEGEIRFRPYVRPYPMQISTMDKGENGD